MFTLILTTLRQRYALHQTVNGLLARADDHLLDDLGMTRADIRALLDAPRTRQAKPVFARAALA